MSSFIKIEKLFHKGDFDQVINAVQDEDSEFSPEETLRLDIILSRIKFHKIDVQGALTTIEKSKNIPKDLIPLDLYHLQKILTGIYQFSLGQVTEAQNLIMGLHGKMEGNEHQLTYDEMRLRGFYYYLRAIVQNYHGEILQAIEDLNLSIEAFMTINEKFELNLVYYKLGQQYRQLGLLEKSNEAIYQSLEYCKQLQIHQDEAVSHTIIGMNNLMLGNYEESIHDIQQGIIHWKDLGSPMGLIWAMSELAIVKYLQGEFSEALKTYIEITELIQKNHSAFHQSLHLLNIVKIACELGKSDIARGYLDKLQKLSENNPSTEVITTRYKLAKAIAESKSSRILEKMTALKEFKSLSLEEEYQVRIESLVHHAKLLLVEIEFTKSKLQREEVISEISEISDTLLVELQKNHNILLEFHLSLLRSQIYILTDQHEEALLLLKDIRKQSQENEYFDFLIKNVTQNQIENLVKRKWFPDLNPLLHSIPRLKILMYLVSRRNVTFSTLSRMTELSPSSINLHTTKLDEVGYIEINQIFINERPLTVYNLSPTGFSELQKYLNDMSRIQI